MGQEIVCTSSISGIRLYETIYISDDDYQVIIWQLVLKKNDSNAKDATVYSCMFVCCSAIFDGPPIYPNSQYQRCTVKTHGRFVTLFVAFNLASDDRFFTLY